jgi:hypothetical protein
MIKAEERTEVFAAFQSLADLLPEMRSGQIVAAVGEVCADLHGRGLWDASDAELLESIWHFRRLYEESTLTAGQDEATATPPPRQGSAPEN